MIILLPLIVFFIYLTLKNAKIKINTTRHTMIRLAVLIIGIPIITLVCMLLDKHSGLLAALYACFYFFCIWAGYILLETISLFIAKQNRLAQVNLLIVGISILIGGMGALLVFN